jgi:hypothetical protein
VASWASLGILLRPLRKVVRRIAQHIPEMLRVIGIAQNVEPLSIGGGNKAADILRTEEVLAVLTRATNVPHSFI